MAFFSGTETKAEPEPTLIVGQGEANARLWLKRLSSELTTQSMLVATYGNYYSGNHPLPELPFRKDLADRYRTKFRDLLRKSRSNWMGLIVEAEEERMLVEGFRFGDDAADKDAWAIWQRNHLDADSSMVHLEAVTSGVSYVSVWPTAEGVTVSPEDPSEVYVASASGNRRTRIAALKRWTDEWTGHDYATVYLPEVIYKFHRPKKDKGWRPRTVRGENWPLPNPLGVVPIVPFYNRPKLGTSGVSELNGVTDIQDRINAALFGRMLAMDFASAPQRWATGITIEVDEDDNPITPFDVAVDRLWTSEDPDAKFGQFDESDLKGYISAVEQDIQHLAAITRTPPHYLLGQSGAFPSGESLKSTETGLVAKVRRQARFFGESWEEVMRLAFAATGDSRAHRFDAETIWSDPEYHTESQYVDAAVKKKELGIPNRQLQEDLGYSQQQIERFPAMVAAERLTQPADVPLPAQEA